MAFGLRMLLWLAIVFLPGGLLLLPVALAFSERERRQRALPSEKLKQHV